MPHLSSTHKIAILTVLVLIGVAAILVPLITIGKFGLGHTNEKKDAIQALKHALTELTDLKHKLTKLWNQTTLAADQVTSVSGRNKRQATIPVTLAPAQPALAQPQVVGDSASVPGVPAAPAAVVPPPAGVPATMTTEIRTSTQAGSVTNSSSTVPPTGLFPANPSNGTLSASVVSSNEVVTISSSLPFLNSSSSHFTASDTTIETVQKSSVDTENGTEAKESPMNGTKVNDVFNTVFDILDKMSTAEKIFRSGDYSSAGNMEELVNRLHESSGSFGKNLLKSTEDTANLVSYLLSKVETEEEKLNKAISQLEVTEVVGKNTTTLTPATATTQNMTTAIPPSFTEESVKIKLNEINGTLAEIDNMLKNLILSNTKSNTSSTSDKLLAEIKDDVEKQLELFSNAFHDVGKADIVALESVKMDLKTELLKLKAVQNLVKQ